SRKATNNSSRPAVSDALVPTQRHDGALYRPVLLVQDSSRWDLVLVFEVEARRATCKQDCQACCDGGQTQCAMSRCVHASILPRKENAHTRWAFSFVWRPHGDSNPGYRRERAVS